MIRGERRGTKAQCRYFHDGRMHASTADGYRAPASCTHAAYTPMRAAFSVVIDTPGTATAAGVSGFARPSIATFDAQRSSIRRYIIQRRHSSGPENDGANGADGDDDNDDDDTASRLRDATQLELRLSRSREFSSV